LLDRTLAFYNTILRCDHYQYKDVELPQGYSIVPYRNGYEKFWAKLEYSIGDFSSLEEAENYFMTTYIQNQKLHSNILFLEHETEVVGTCIAWQDKREESVVSSLHWLIVDEKYQGMGLGKALCYAVMNIFEKQGNFPVYIHTQPWSWKAIFLYLSIGFKLQKKDTFSHYENEYDKAMSELKKVVTQEEFDVLRELSD
jgi:ribosomal protein S18 acetylase RimI-like enzyme